MQSLQSMLGARPVFLSKGGEYDAAKEDKLGEGNGRPAGICCLARTGDVHQ